MAQTNINIRIDENLKKQFDSLCSELGLTMSTAINIFAKAFVRYKGMPFDVNLNVPNAETLQAIDDVNNHRNLIGPFNSTEELMKSLLDEEE